MISTFQILLVKEEGSDENMIVSGMKGCTGALPAEQSFFFFFFSIFKPLVSPSSFSSYFDKLVDFVLQIPSSTSIKTVNLL